MQMEQFQYCELMWNFLYRILSNFKSKIEKSKSCSFNFYLKKFFPWEALHVRLFYQSLLFSLWSRKSMNNTQKQWIIKENIKIWVKFTSLSFFSFKVYRFQNAFNLSWNISKTYIHIFCSHEIIFFYSINIKWNIFSINTIVLVDFVSFLNLDNHILLHLRFTEYRFNVSYLFLITQLNLYPDFHQT